MSYHLYRISCEYSVIIKIHSWSQIHDFPQKYNVCRYKKQQQFETIDTYPKLSCCMNMCVILMQHDNEEVLFIQVTKKPVNENFLPRKRYNYSNEKP